MSCNQNLNQMMTTNNCCQVQPIVMPTQVITRQRVSFMEQPIIYPIECRTVNRVILVPRYYRAFSQSCMTNTNLNNNNNFSNQ